MNGLQLDNSEIPTSSPGGVNVEHARNMVKLALSPETPQETATSAAAVIETPVRERETGELIDSARHGRVQDAQQAVADAYPTEPAPGLSIEDLLQAQ